MRTVYRIPAVGLEEVEDIMLSPSHGELSKLNAGRLISVIVAATFLTACGGGDGNSNSPAPPQTTSPAVPATLAAARTFPAMPRDTLELPPLTGRSSVTFSSGLPFNDLEYTLLDTDYIEGETAGFDTFMPVDTAAPVPGANRIKIVRTVNNLDIDRNYDAQEGARIILGTAEIATPFFARGADGIDNDYAVISNFDYRNGHIQLKGTASDYELRLCTTQDGCATNGYYLFHTASGSPDLIAFIFPCDDVALPVSGNPYVQPEFFCNASRNLSLGDPNQFRFAGAKSTAVSVPQGLTQFGTAGKEIVGGQAVGLDGSIYVFGETDGRLSGGPALAPGSGDAGNRIFVTKHAATGALQWVREIDLPDGALLFDGVTDSEHLYVAGRTFGALPGFTGRGAWDGIILKLRISDGVVVATDQFGNEGLDGYGNIILDDAGNLYVSAQGSPPGAMGTDPLHLVAKHRSSDLRNVWRQLVSPGSTNVNVSEAWGGLSYIPSSTPGGGRLVAAGWFFGDGAGGAGSWLETYGNLNAAQPTRTATAIVSSPGFQADWILDNAVDPAGNIYVAGYTTGDLSGSHRGNGDAFIAKYDTNLRLIAIRQLGTAMSDSFRKLVYSNGSLYAVGYTYGDFGGTNADPAKETGDVVVVSFDTELNQRAIRQFGTPHEDRGYIDVFGGNVISAGITEASLAGTSAGAFDAFVVKLTASSLTFTR